MSRDFPVTGLADVLDRLSQIGGSLETQAIKSGLTAGAAIVRDEARRNVPRKSGKLAKAIVSGSPRKLQDGNYSITNDHAFIGLFLEFGAAAHMIGRKSGKGVIGGSTVLKVGDRFVSGPVQHPGIAPRPFMRPALDTKAEEVIQAFRAKIIAVVEGKTGFTLDAPILDEAA
jgi:HK97 gp10 family phage protein